VSLLSSFSVLQLVLIQSAGTLFCNHLLYSLQCWIVSINILEIDSYLFQAVQQVLSQTLHQTLQELWTNPTTLCLSFPVSQVDYAWISLTPYTQSQILVNACDRPGAYQVVEWGQPGLLF
jgi:hypothetical protein